MDDKTEFDLYEGNGKRLSERKAGGRVPPFEPDEDSRAPGGYLADKGLRDAVNVALALGQPLLLTGDPGTGKTQLAWSLAHELELGEPLVFQVKTTSTARDLFYQYDALRHFHDAQPYIQLTSNALPAGAPDAAVAPGLRRLSAEDYITYQALGLAILLSMEPERAAPYLSAKHQHAEPRRSVVLIDEIDKAPRDLPNDILAEIEDMSFTVRETGNVFRAEQGYRPILVFTSNSEKNLPDAFLRRCVYYNIRFPGTEKLKEIVRSRIRRLSYFTPEMLHNAVTHFEDIRERGLRKAPTTAELIAWVRVLDRMKIDVNNLKPGQAEALAFSYSILAKTKEDADRLLIPSVKKS